VIAKEQRAARLNDPRVQQAIANNCATAVSTAKSAYYETRDDAKITNSYAMKSEEQAANRRCAIVLNVGRARDSSGGAPNVSRG